MKQVNEREKALVTDEKMLHCAAQIVKTYFEDHKYGKVPFEHPPCNTCYIGAECQGNRIISVRTWLTEVTGIPISFMGRPKDPRDK